MEGRIKMLKEMVQRCEIRLELAISMRDQIAKAHEQRMIRMLKAEIKELEDV